MTITREQVARAIELSKRGSGISEAFGGCGWARVHGVPRQVVEAWSAIPFNDDRMTAALTRWRDELAAAEPIDDTAPERLRERRERADAAQAARMQRDAADYAAALSAEEERRAALTKGSDKPHMLPSFRKAIAEMRAGGASLSEVADAYSLGIGEVSEALDAEPERPAPRFKVGDWVRVVTGPLSAGRDRAIQVTHLTSGYIHADGLPWADWQIEPAAPPAPDVVDVPQPDPLAYADSPAWDDWPMPKPVPALEMVDVPQPIVKRVSGVMVDGRDEDQYALWVRGESVIALTFVRNDSADSRESVSIALLRAMLEAIDAQQGGAS